MAVRAPRRCRACCGPHLKPVVDAGSTGVLPFESSTPIDYPLPPAVAFHVRDGGRLATHFRSLYARITVCFTVLPSRSDADARSDTDDAPAGWCSAATRLNSTGTCCQDLPSS